MAEFLIKFLAQGHMFAIKSLSFAYSPHRTYIDRCIIFSDHAASEFGTRKWNDLVFAKKIHVQVYTTLLMVMVFYCVRVSD
jgi:hypothetical protein